MTHHSDPKTGAISRRHVLKTAGAAATAVTGIAGFPYVHAQEKITLRYLGTAVNQDKKIAEKLREVAIGQSVAEVPTHGEHDHLGREPKPRERRQRSCGWCCSTTATAHRPTFHRPVSCVNATVPATPSRRSTANPR
mgnify:CR=1 FL=1